MPPKQNTGSFSNMFELSSTGIAERWLERSELADIYVKVVKERRLSREDGLRLDFWLTWCESGFTVRKPTGSTTSILTIATSA
jgi:hypothetical protein